MKTRQRNKTAKAFTKMARIYNTPFEDYTLEANTLREVVEEAGIKLTALDVERGFSWENF
jgi:hypothetical protein